MLGCCGLSELSGVSEGSRRVREGGSSESGLELGIELLVPGRSNLGSVRLEPRCGDWSESWEAWEVWGVSRGVMMGWSPVLGMILKLELVSRSPALEGLMLSCGGQSEVWGVWGAWEG